MCNQQHRALGHDPRQPESGELGRAGCSPSAPKNGHVIHLFLEGEIMAHNTEAVACRIPTQCAISLRNMADFNNTTVSAVLSRIVVDRLMPTAPAASTGQR